MCKGGGIPTSQSHAELEQSQMHCLISELWKFQEKEITSDYSFQHYLRSMGPVVDVVGR